MLSVRTASLRNRATRLACITATPKRYLYNEGAVAQSKEFSKKERAHEDQFVKQHEATQLKKLREEIEKKRIELETLEKEHEATLEKVNGGGTKE